MDDMKMRKKLTPDQAMDRNRSVFTKGRLEFMGGPVSFEQGHGVEGFEDQSRKNGEASCYMDPMAVELGVDIEG